MVFAFNFFAAVLAHLSALPKTTVDNRRRSYIVKQQKLYDYVKYTKVRQFIHNKEPLPAAENPSFAWMLKALQAYLRAKSHLVGSRVRLQKMRDSSVQGLAGYILLSVLEISDVLRVMAIAAYYISTFQMDHAATFVGQNVTKSADHAALSAEKNQMHGKQNATSLAPNYIDGVDEKDEARATADYREFVGYSSLNEEERAFFDNFDCDQVFAHVRVAGPNPMSIRRVYPSDMSSESWKPTDKHLCDADDCLKNDTLETALSENRLYMLEYDWLKNVPDAEDGSRFIFVPKALFVIPAAEEDRAKMPLIPVAIWIYRRGLPESKAEIFTRRDGYSWQIAKLIVNVLDANDHEYFRHLMGTHLLMEPFSISLKRNLHYTHPLYQLLSSHFEGTMFINHNALSKLIAVGGAVDRNLMSPVQELAKTLGEKMETIQFNDMFLPRDLERRGVMDRKLEYPYRDDALAVWEAVNTWVSSYVSEFYPNDADVMGDAELQAFAEEIQGPKVGLKGFGDSGFLNGTSKYVISTRSYLIDVITMIVFTASCQHAAVNFPQKQFLSYSPAWPFCFVQAQLPGSGNNSSVVGWAEWRKWFPSWKQTSQQWMVSQLLGSVYYTRLGEYPVELTAGRPNIARCLDKFKSDLRGIGENIQAREDASIRENNRTGIKYLFLHPKNIPASINV